MPKYKITPIIFLIGLTILLIAIVYMTFLVHWLFGILELVIAITIINITFKDTKH